MRGLVFWGRYTQCAHAHTHIHVYFCFRMTATHFSKYNYNRCADASQPRTTLSTIEKLNLYETETYLKFEQCVPELTTIQPINSCFLGLSLCPSLFHSRWFCSSVIPYVSLCIVYLKLLNGIQSKITEYLCWIWNCIWKYVL